MADYDVESILSKVIDSNEAIWSPQEKIPLIMKEIEHLKADTKTFLDSCDYDIKGILRESSDLCSESKALVEEMKKCKEEIEEETMAEILQSIADHDQIAKELNSVSFALNIVLNVIKCGKLLKEYEEGREAQSFSKSVESVYGLLHFVEQPVDGFGEIQMYTSIKNTTYLIMDSLTNDLMKEWDLMVSYSVSSGPPGSIPEKSTVTFDITLDDSPTAMDVVNALDKSTKLMIRLKEFAYFLKTETFIPILKYDSRIYSKSEDSIILTIIREANFTPMYEDTLTNMKVLFNFLNDKFNLPLNNNKTILKILGELLCEEFCEMMINDCWIKTIPCNINSLQNYGRVTKQIEDFEQLLRTINFFPEEGLTLLKYMDNIDVLFAEQSSQHCLKTARSIMFKDLSVSMSIGVEKIPDEFIPEDDIPEDDIPEDFDITEALDIFAEVFPNSLFYFPRCMISRSAQELLDLVYIVMEQAARCPDVVCKKLYSTVRLIFEMYDAVVPYHHENYLDTIPQYVALFHNNCMYLAHNLQTLGDKWLTMMDGREVDYPISFVDLVQKIRDLGYKHLTMHMQQQRKQILDNIRSSDLNCIVVKDVLGDNAEAAVRQCLRQLQLLKNVWVGVFPSNVFKRLMGTLLNMFVEELIHRVCTVEDISMEMATQLTEIYTLVVQKAPPLFQNLNDVTQHVKSWDKLQELIFVLGGSLKDIEKHWNDGSGPLAVHFHVDELRSLIKALFQNTQFRANLLSKIK